MNNKKLTNEEKEKIQTLFLNAAAYCKLQKMQALISSYPNIQFDYDQALTSAAAGGSLKIVKFLVKLGANITANKHEALWHASYEGKLPIIRYFIEQGMDITANNNQAIINAASQGHLKIIKLLVEYGANIKAQNNEVLKQAIVNQRFFIMKYCVFEHNMRTKFVNKKRINDYEKKIANFILDRIEKYDLNVKLNNELSVKKETQIIRKKYS